jgi:hypothetical protein
VSLEITGNWNVVIPKEIARISRDLVRTADTIFGDLFAKIIYDTPVDIGTLRASWNFSWGDPVFDVQPPGRDAVAAMKASFVSTYHRGAQNTYTLANGLPYAHVVEYGLYPNPVKKGTWLGPGMGYEIRSVGGYSKKAPQGMVRINIVRFQEAVEEAAAAVRAGG